MGAWHVEQWGQVDSDQGAVASLLLGEDNRSQGNIISTMQYIVTVIIIIIIIIIMLIIIIIIIISIITVSYYKCYYCRAAGPSARRANRPTGQPDKQANDLEPRNLSHNNVIM